MKTSKIILPIVIILATSIIGVGFYKKEKAVPVPALQTLPSAPPTSASNSQQSEIDALKNEVEGLKQRPPQTVVQGASPSAPKSNDTDYSVIVSEWQDRVAKVICDWNYPDGSLIQSAQASGLLWKYKSAGTALITNRHVVDENGYGANQCRVGVYGKGSRLISNTGILVGSNEDFAVIKLGSEYSLPDSPSNSDGGSFDAIASQHGKACTDQVNIGDKLIVLGYPAIGTQGGITVTEGIVSGFEGNYYVTSAKIDHGNSGGASQG